MPGRRAVSLVLALFVTMSLLAVPAATAETVCDPADPILQGPPANVPGQGAEPVRTDSDGAQTLTLLVHDPAFPGTTWGHTAVYPNGTVPPEIRAALTALGVDEVGVFSHVWPVSRNIVSYGLYVIRDGQRLRVPLFLIENGAAPDVVTAAAVAALEEALPLALNGTPYALNVVAPTPTGFIAPLFLVPTVGPILGSLAQTLWTMHNNGYPSPAGYSTRPPLYVWDIFRKQAGAEAWKGTVVMHDGSYTTSGGTREGCRRTRIGPVVREGSATTFLGGVFVLDHVKGSDDGRTTFEARQTLTAGSTVGGPAPWTDVPLTTVRQSERKQDAGGSYVLYPDRQEDEIALGTSITGDFVPLLGVRAEATHAGPPNAQDRLVALGVYDPAGTFVPVVGARSHFERLPADLWALYWALSGGPGTQAAGDWSADVGAFDPQGGFVPLFGATYADDFADGHHTYQMMVTAGPWTAGTYRPAVGATYDGEVPLVPWALANALNVSPGMGRWQTSVGTFSPLGDYVPVAGAAYRPGSTTASYPVVEEYLVGLYAARYADFVPAAGARWSGKQTSGSWAVALANGAAVSPGVPPAVTPPYGRAPSDARVDAGPVDPFTGQIVPVAGGTATAGDRDRYAVGVWAAGGFVPLLEACHSGSLPRRNGAVGVAVPAPAGRVPVAWAGMSGGTPQAGTGDCPL